MVDFATSKSKFKLFLYEYHPNQKQQCKSSDLGAKLPIQWVPSSVP